MQPSQYGEIFFIYNAVTTGNAFLTSLASTLQVCHGVSDIHNKIRANVFKIIICCIAD